MSQFNTEIIANFLKTFRMFQLFTNNINRNNIKHNSANNLESSYFNLMHSQNTIEKLNKRREPAVILFCRYKFSFKITKNKINILNSL